MAKEKEDMRVVRTRKMLCKALMDLLQTTPFDKLSVNDICERAEVHRATFYNHFSDKNDLLNFALDDLQEELFEKCIENRNFSSQKEMYMALVECVMDFMSQRREKLKLIFNNSVDKISILVSTTLRRSIRYLLGKNKCKQDFAIPIDIIVDFYTGGIGMIGLNWLESENPHSKEEMLKSFDILLGENNFLKK